MDNRKFWILALMGIMLVWATVHPITKVLTKGLSPETIAFFRLFFSLLFFIPYIALRGRMPKPDGKDWKNILGASLFGAFANILLLNYGIRLSTASAASVIINLAPLFVALMAVFFLSEKMTKRKAVALLVGVTGAALVVTNGELTWLSQPGYLFGNILLLFSSLCLSLGTFYALPLSRKFGGVRGQFLALLPGTLMLFALWAAQGGLGSLDSITLWQWLGLLWIGVVVTGGCWSVFFESLRHLGPTTSMSFKLLLPVFTAFYAVTLLNETLTPLFITGMALVLAGLTTLGGKQQPT